MASFMTLNKLVLFIFLFKVIGSKKLSSRDLNGLGSGKLSECRRCRLLTNSFEHWLDKTSRGKYEGGDAAWEEAKLKSYSRSEIRLVEIQEGLCSELKTNQDECYAIGEEAEQVIENWWFREDPNSVDLYTWLCIETLQHCCPKSHFGEACTPCPRDKENKPCSEHGKCDGDGTRKGNGTCLCRKGYAGVVCDECAQNYYKSNNDKCEVCHKACDGCRGEGASACTACAAGWHDNLGVCVDMDECSTDVCNSDQYCINKEGSFSCDNCDISCKSCMGEGPSNCTACHSPNVLWFGTCDSHHQQNILNTAYKRIAMYIGFLIILIFIVRTSKLLASIVVIIISAYIYYLERNLRMNTADILFHIINNVSYSL